MSDAIRKPEAEILPPLSDNEAMEEDHGGFISTSALERYEEWLDSKFHIPGLGIRVGLDGMIGLIPGFGDLTTTGISAIFLADAWKSGARKRVLFRMLMNIGIDFLVGAIPFFGDLFDFAFKSNTKNLRLLKSERDHLRKMRNDGVTK